MTLEQSNPVVGTLPGPSQQEPPTVLQLSCHERPGESGHRGGVLSEPLLCESQVHVAFLRSSHDEAKATGSTYRRQSDASPTAFAEQFR
jgi:hypothetical protein